MSKYPEIDAVLAGESDGCIVCGDCREVMLFMPHACIGLVVTSPPFNMGQHHHTSTNRHTPYPDDMPESEYQEWQKDILRLLWNITTNEAPLFYQHRHRIRKGVLINPLDWITDTPWVVRQEVVWINGGQNMDSCRFYPQTERIWWLAHNTATKLNNTSGLTDWWHIAPRGTQSGNSRSFPDEIPIRCINVTESPGIVFDPFAGAGTTCAAAKRLGFRYIGVEINEKYHGKAVCMLQHPEKPLFT